MQNAEQNRMKPMIEAAIIDLCTSTSTLFPRNMVIADLGCSSGTNALVLVSTAIEAIHSYCIQFQRQPPEVCIFLNDLPDNDFNTVVKSLVALRQSNKPLIMTGVVPGSFTHFTNDSSLLTPCILFARPTACIGSQRCEFGSAQWIVPLQYSSTL
jgi:jasmonate O-methyltransferase